MPKEVFVINEFHGGKDSKTDQRDINFESSVEQVNIDTSENLSSDRRGKVKVSGAFEFIKELESIEDNDNLLDSSCMVYGSDYSLLPKLNSEGELAEDDEIEYLKPTLIPYVDGDKIRVYDSSVESGENHSNGELLDFNLEEGSIDPVYFVAQGGLVICDKNLEIDSESQMLKLSKYTFFKDYDWEYTVAKWYAGTSFLNTPPEDSLVIGGQPTEIETVHINFDNSDPPVSTEYVEYYMEPEFVNNLVIGLSFEYDRSSDTDLFFDSFIDGGTIINGTALNTAHPVRVNISFLNSEENQWNPRITGFKLYYQILGATEWKLLSDVNFLRGDWRIPSYSPYRQSLADFNGIKKVSKS